MYRSLFLIIAILSFNACTFVKEARSKSVYSYARAYEQMEQITENQEFDSLVIKAYSYEKIGAFKEARDIFLKLFKDYHNADILENAFMISLMNGLDKQDELNTLAKPFLKKSPSLTRLSVIYHLQRNEFNTAQSLIENLIKRDKDFRNYEILGDLHLRKQQFNLALTHYKKSKAFLPESASPNEVLTLKIAEMQLLLKQPQKAKKELESFVNELACTPRVCLLLAKIYDDEKDKSKLEDLYIKLYQGTNDKIFIRALMQGLIDEKRHKKALEIALTYDIDDELVLYLYQNLGKFKEAKEFALELYKKNNNKIYLLTAAVMEFEEATKQKKINKDLLNSVVYKFEEGIDEQSEALFLNYYGYLLIDYDLDIKKGIDIVLKALAREPDNLFYLDSLSWGYYKQGDCNKAWDIMLKTMHNEEFISSEESKEHIQAIKQCLIKDKK